MSSNQTDWMILMACQSGLDKFKHKGWGIAFIVAFLVLFLRKGFFADGPIEYENFKNKSIYLID